MIRDISLSTSTIEGEFCDEFGLVRTAKKTEDSRPLCKADHYHSWFSKQVMKEALKMPGAAREREEQRFGWTSLESSDDDDEQGINEKEKVPQWVEENVRQWVEEEEEEGTCCELVI